jgi:hypothetical protein
VIDWFSLILQSITTFYLWELIMVITIKKNDGSVVETNAIALARKLNNIVVDKMADGVLGKPDIRWDQADFINCMIDTIDTMFTEKDFK